MVEVFFNLGQIHFATNGQQSVPKDQLSVALWESPYLQFTKDRGWLGEKGKSLERFVIDSVATIVNFRLSKHPPYCVNSFLKSKVQES